MEDTIKSHTNCPTCGSEVDVKANGTTHYYVPKSPPPPARVVTDEEINEKYPFLLGSASIFNIDMVRRREGAKWMRSLLSQDNKEGGNV